MLQINSPNRKRKEAVEVKSGFLLKKIELFNMTLNNFDQKFFLSFFAV